MELGHSKRTSAWSIRGVSEDVSETHFSFLNNVIKHTHTHSLSLPIYLSFSPWATQYSPRKLHMTSRMHHVIGDLQTMYYVTPASRNKWSSARNTWAARGCTYCVQGVTYYVPFRPRDTSPMSRNTSPVSRITSPLWMSDVIRCTTHVISYQDPRVTWETSVKLRMFIWSYTHV